MEIKHSKYKNTGVIFELLVRQITSDTLSNKDSKAVNILKKYFVKTELGREYKLYETLLKNTNLSEGKAEMIISTILESSKHLNQSILKRQKYNLIKEIKTYYNVDEFFRTKLPNYKAQASIYILLENYTQNSSPNISQVINNKLTLLEYLTSLSSNKQIIENEVMEEFKKQDKDVRVLTYRILLDKFNTKYGNLNENQKLVLKEFIESTDSTIKLKTFYNQNIVDIKNEILTLQKSISDKVTVIKLNEIVNYLVELDKTSKVTNDHLVNLLQYYELLEELKLIK
jgi:hypothetical protein